jgi:hypothetical protein
VDQRRTHDTKIHAAADEHGRPRRRIIRPGHRGDVPVAPVLIGATHTGGAIASIVSCWL